MSVSLSAVAVLALLAAPAGGAAATTTPDPTTAAAYNLGGDVSGVYTDPAGKTFTGKGQIVVVIDGAFNAGNSQFTDASGASKIAGEACIGQPVGTTPWPSLCTPATTIQPTWPGSHPIYFSELPGAATPGNAPFNTCSDGAGGFCHNGHGTGVAGAVVGQPSTRYELDGRVHRAAGAAVGAQVFQIKIGGGTGTASGWPHASVVDALNWVDHVLAERPAYKGRIAAVSLSVSGGQLAAGSACPAAGQAVDAVAGRLVDRGIAVVMAAGNEGITGVGTWNCGANVVRVGATNVSSPTLASYTNRSADVQLYAPVGDGVFAGSNKLMVPYRSSGWWFVTGTSFAAPQVAGAYAVLREKFGGTPSVAALTALLQSTGTPVTGTGAPAGAKIVDLAAALAGTP